ncbi:MAG: nucleotidyltransferase family protein [Oscillospiraceae bacterium]|nr:nucleotidyltransferase family protein [Oscillospiraceae bacterium]
MPNSAQMGRTGPVCGVVAEYNPFHRGHAWHLAETRRALGAECVLVCAMSGAFVQRGSPAFYGKRPRAEAAVRCGADLVLELPLPWALAPAETFASGAVGLLRAAGAGALSFGSECGDVGALRRTAALLADPALDARTRELLRAGASYAAARQQAAEELAGEALPLLRSPNDILALEYCKAAGQALELLAIPRRGSGHDTAEGGDFPSASWLRGRIGAGEDVDALLPPEAAAVFARERTMGRGPVTPEALDTALLSRLRLCGAAELAQVPGVGEGLEHRLLRALEAPSLAEAVARAATKRYPDARLRRALLSAALGLRKGDSAGPVPYLRVLAANERGRAHLAALRKTCPLPLITKPAAGRKLPENAGRVFALCARAEDVYVLGCPDSAAREGGQDWRAGPVLL